MYGSITNTNQATETAVVYNLETIRDIIYEIIEIHKDFSSNNKKLCNVNLKSTHIRDVVSIMDNDSYIISNDFLTNIYKYLEQLKLVIATMDFEETYEHLDFRHRTKDPVNIIHKIGHYLIGKDGKGAYSLNKCLNDLLGFRICVDDFDHNCSIFYNMCDYIKEKDYNIKCINSSKGEYRATHIYFKGASNMFFPWELQIWHSDDFQKNHDSHEVYKQTYTNSAKIHKEGFTIKRQF